jgi:hypothetical protein
VKRGRWDGGEDDGLDGSDGGWKTEREKERVRERERERARATCQSEPEK